MRYKLLCSVLFIVCFITTANAQRYFGVATGEYNVMNSLYLNPANIAGCSEKIVVSVFSINVGVDNNLGTFTSLSNFGNNAAFNNSGTKDFSMLVPVGEVRGPGVLVSLNDDHKQTFALTTRIRGFNQLNNFDQSLYTTATGSNRSSNQNYSYQTNNFNWTAHLWSEVGISYGIVLLDNDESQLKAGITLRYLGGIDYLSLKGNNLNVSYTAGSDSFYASHSDLEFASNAISANDAISNGVSSSSIFSSLLGSKAGSGLGADVGVTYTYRIEEGDGDDHPLTISAAVTDIGAIKYKEGSNFMINVSGNGYITGTGLSQHLSNYSDFRNYVVSQGYTVDTNSKANKVYMPTAFLISADYNIYQKFYANVAYVANLANRQNFGNSYYNQFTITPRYDTKVLSVGLPITYSALAHDLKVGLGFRIGGFFIGSDDMLALVSNNQRGFGAYMGAYIPIFKKKSKTEAG